MPITSPIVRAFPRTAASAGAGRRVERDAFLFMLPQPPAEKFGQCGTCGAFIAAKQRCYWHRKSDVIDEDDSCGLYAHGAPMGDAAPTGAVTPEVSGLYDGEVRCRHCRFADKGATRCALYAELNEALPLVFALDARIDPHACCNAFEPPPGKAAGKRSGDDDGERSRDEGAR
jgi:hypothetical protein